MIFKNAILKAYKQSAFTRCDNDGTAFYFSSDDFYGLHKENYPFLSRLGHTLQGYIYSYDNPIKNTLVIFDHGFGGGHTAYMKEIEKLCSKGYSVLAYDHTGCMASGGENTNGMAQSLHDLDDCLTHVKADPSFKDYDLYVMGHSWGGFSTLNISYIHKEIKKVVVMCGFVSVENLIASNFSGLLKGYRKDVLEVETNANPKYVGYNAINSLKNSSAKCLLIYSSNDHLCKKLHYDELYENLKDQENIEFLLVHEKWHNPNYTKEAVMLLNEYIKEKTMLLKKKKLSTDEEKKAFLEKYDFNKMTEQDEEVWNKIFKHLSK